ncbi:MAG TPA: sigma-70 family RNA polymerase sigma factor [Solirubrobacteraceae bacterium]|nr:sigma-70 family RNA polymerase sigma factor [Solirubrobacteraceae bacterium]
MRRFDESPPTDSSKDLAQLYGQLSKRLERIVRRDVRAPDPVIEDACQFAWVTLVSHRDRVRQATTLPWLVKTAQHEAFKLVRRDGRDHSLEATLEQAGDGKMRLSAPDPEELAVAHDRLGQLERLPARQQRLMWLQGFGLSYAEMARHTGDTTRTVERQLLRARQAVRGFELE